MFKLIENIQGNLKYLFTINVASLNVNKLCKHAFFRCRAIDLKGKLCILNWVGLNLDM